jgi:hypothetical protein
MKMKRERVLSILAAGVLSFAGCPAQTGGSTAGGAASDDGPCDFTAVVRADKKSGNPAALVLTFDRPVDDLKQAELSLNKTDLVMLKPGTLTENADSTVWTMDLQVVDKPGADTEVVNVMVKNHLVTTEPVPVNIVIASGTASIVIPLGPEPSNSEN